MAAKIIGQVSTAAFLGIDGGGTKSIGAYQCGDIRRRIEGGPGNLRLLSDSQLLALFRGIAAGHNGLPKPVAVAIGMASARLESDRERIRRFAAKAWPRTPCFACDDLQTALAAAEAEATAQKASSFEALVVTLAGTGSCFFGRNSRGKTIKVGGWGHILGDDGGAYAMGLHAMRAVVWEYDREGVVPPLGRRLLRALLLNKPEEISAWAVNATKSDVGGLAVEVAAAARAGDRIAKRILDAAARNIATEAVTCARRLTKTGAPVRFVFTGSVLVKNSDVARKAAKLIRADWPNATTVTLGTESAWGAVELARRHFESLGSHKSPNEDPIRPAPQKTLNTQATLDSNLIASPTEQRNPRSRNLHKLPLRKAIALMLNEDERIPAAILRESAIIERAVEYVVQSFRKGGRLFYVGAGTSGRLGVLDASECPPTFRSDPEMVQGIIAGGQTALWKAVEGAEDDPDEGARAVECRGVTSRDTVIGIAASGRTPFVWGALKEAKRRGAKTVLLTFNPHLNIPPKLKPSLVIAPNVGPEILTGSTRLKSGTATKLILNILTTLAMVRIGKVLGNLMVDLKPSNVKLRDRAVRIVRALTNVGEQQAMAELERSGWVIKTAVARLESDRRRTKKEKT